MLSSDYKDILSALNEEKAEYIIVGAYAIAVHGFPRATGDIAIWINHTRENVKRVWRALTEFGAPLADYEEADLYEEGVVIQIGVAPARIDILTSIDNVNFSEAWEARMEVEVEGIIINAISKEHLIINKKAIGRPQDLVDIERLKNTD